MFTCSVNTNFFNLYIENLYQYHRSFNFYYRKLSLHNLYEFECRITINTQEIARGTNQQENSTKILRFYFFVFASL